MANCIKLKLLGLSERDVQLTKSNMLILMLLQGLLLFVLLPLLQLLLLLQLLARPRALRWKFQEVYEHTGYQKEIISNVTTTANCIKLKLLGLDERDILLTKRQYVNTTAVTRTTAITINTSTSNANTTILTIITTMPNGMKVIFT